MTRNPHTIRYPVIETLRDPGTGQVTLRFATPPCEASIIKEFDSTRVEIRLDQDRALALHTELDLALRATPRVLP